MKLTNGKVLDSSKVGERIRRIRKHKKMSMKDLAQEVGVSFSYIAKIETGQNRLSVDMLYRIARALRVSIDSLFRSEDLEEQKLREQGWYLLKDFFVVHYDAEGRPEQAFYDIQNREANVIGQLRDLEEMAPEVAERIFQAFEAFAQRKDPSIFASLLPPPESASQKVDTTDKRATKAKAKSKRKRGSSKKGRAKT